VRTTRRNETKSAQLESDLITSNRNARWLFFSFNHSISFTILFFFFYSSPLSFKFINKKWKLETLVSNYFSTFRFLLVFISLFLFKKKVFDFKTNWICRRKLWFLYFVFSLIFHASLDSVVIKLPLLLGWLFFLVFLKFCWILLRVRVFIFNYNQHRLKLARKL
jgi:hypothetical protein